MRGSSSRIEPQAAPGQPSGVHASVPSAPVVSGPASEQTGSAASAGGKKLLKMGVPIAVVLAALVAAGLYFRSRSASKLTQQDTIVLADFTNTTGDPVVDGTLKKALAGDVGPYAFTRFVPG